MKKRGYFVLAALVCCLALTMPACKGKKGSPMFALPQGEARHVVFVTSAAGNGNLGSWADAGGKNGLQAADAICQTHANLAGLPGTYRAWLSDDTDDAYCRIQNLSGKAAANCGAGNLIPAAGPWVRTDGTPFSGAINDLVLNNGNNGVIYTPIRYDENGNLITSGVYWVGTLPSGKEAVSGNCNNWTGIAAGNEVVISTTDSTTVVWTGWYTSDSACRASTTSLACFRTGPGPALGAFAKPGKKVFVTSEAWNGNLGGLVGADAICTNSAANAGLAAGNYKPWLSTSAANAIERLGAYNGPWVTLDGIVVAGSKSELTSNRLQSTITKAETGDYVYVNVWSGTDAHGLGTGEKCADWTSNAAGNHGIYGFPADAYILWSNASLTACNGTNHLYCFEE